MYNESTANQNVEAWNTADELFALLDANICK